MQAYKKRLKDYNDNIIYPETVFSMIKDEVTGQSLQEYINKLYNSGFYYGGIISGALAETPTQNTFYIVPPISTVNDAEITINNSISAKPDTVSVVTATVTRDENSSVSSTTWKCSSLLQISSKLDGTHKNYVASELAVSNIHRDLDSTNETVRSQGNNITDLQNNVRVINEKLKTASSRRYSAVCSSDARDGEKVILVDGYDAVMDNDIFYISFIDGIAPILSTFFNLHIKNLTEEVCRVTVIISNNTSVSTYNLSDVKRDKYYPFLLKKDLGIMYLIGDLDKDTVVPMANETTDGSISASDYAALQKLKNATKHRKVYYDPNSTVIFNAKCDSSNPDNVIYKSSSLCDLLEYCLSTDVAYSNGCTNYHFIFTDTRPNNEWVTNPDNNYNGMLDKSLFKTGAVLRSIYNSTDTLVNPSAFNANNNVKYHDMYFDYNMEFDALGYYERLSDDLQTKLKNRIEGSVDHKFHIYFDFYNLVDANPNIYFSVNIINSKSNNGTTNRIVYQPETLASMLPVGTTVDDNTNLTEQVSGDRISTVEIVFTCDEYEHVMYGEDNVTPITEEPIVENVFNAELILHHNAVIG